MRARAGGGQWAPVSAAGDGVAVIAGSLVFALATNLG
jgi:hypothetical protein